MRRGDKVKLVNCPYGGLKDYGYYEHESGDQHYIKCFTEPGDSEVYYYLNDKNVTPYFINRAEIRDILERLDILEQFKMDIERSCDEDR
jgi:hypothetical protein